MDISVQKTFLFEFCHRRRGWTSFGCRRWMWKMLEVLRLIQLIGRRGKILIHLRPPADRGMCGLWRQSSSPAVTLLRLITRILIQSSCFSQFSQLRYLPRASGVGWCHHQYNANTWASTNTNTILCHNGRPARGIPRTALYTISGIGFISRSSNHVSHCWLRSSLRFPFSDFGVRGNMDRRRPLLPWSIFPSWHLNAQ